MEYREMLTHLVRFHRVEDTDLNSFGARVHVLRKTGIPPVAKVGRGSRATFSMEDLTEIHLGLALSEHGFTPMRIHAIMESIRKTREWWPFTKCRGGWLVISNLESGDGPGGFLVSILETDEELLKFVKKNGAPLWHAVLNLAVIGEHLRSVD